MQANYHRYASATSAEGRQPLEQFPWMAQETSAALRSGIEAFAMLKAACCASMMPSTTGDGPARHLALQRAIQPPHLKVRALSYELWTWPHVVVLAFMDDIPRPVCLLAFSRDEL